MRDELPGSPDMGDAPLIVREEMSELYAWSLIPFRTVTLAMRNPAWPKVANIETDEVRYTCPDGWHQSPVFLAMATT